MFPTLHFFCFIAECYNLFGVPVESNNRRLIKNDPLVLYID
jgi:hypothetical protein